MPGRMFCLESKLGVWSQGCGSAHVLPSQVHGSGGWLGNWSGDEVGMVLIRLKNDLGTLHALLGMDGHVKPPSRVKSQKTKRLHQATKNNSQARGTNTHHCMLKQELYDSKTTSMTTRSWRI